MSNTVHGRYDEMPVLKANYGLIEDTLEVGITVLIIAVIIGNVDLPLFYAVSTTGWGTPNIALWGVITITCIAVLIMEIVDKMKPYRT